MHAWHIYTCIYIYIYNTEHISLHITNIYTYIHIYIYILDNEEVLRALFNKINNGSGYVDVYPQFNLSRLGTDDEEVLAV